MKVRTVSTISGFAMVLASLAAAPGVAAASSSSVAAGPAVAHASGRPWTNPALPPASRARLLVARMTLDEKIAMVHGAGYPLPLNGAGYAGVVPANPRLGIPALYLADSPVGVGNGSTGVTQWADTSALASTWDTSLASAYGSADGPERAGQGPHR